MTPQNRTNSWLSSVRIGMIEKLRGVRPPIRAVELDWWGRADAPPSRIPQESIWGACSPGTRLTSVFRLLSARGEEQRAGSPLVAIFAAPRIPFWWVPSTQRRSGQNLRARAARSLLRTVFRLWFLAVLLPSGCELWRFPLSSTSPVHPLGGIAVFADCALGRPPLAIVLRR
jgi:hypothetical protein